jgi:hypothetical protein
MRALRAEGVVLFLFTLLAYHRGEFAWPWFFSLLLVPDISMVGYLKDPRAGAFIYNLGHSYVLPVITLGASWLLESRAGLAVALVWCAHIAMDRALGFGLKSPHSFRETHLGHL